MDLTRRIDAFSRLGEFLAQFTPLGNIQNDSRLNSRFFARFDQLISDIHIYNPWFTSQMVRFAVSEIADQISYDNLDRWLSQYPELNHSTTKTIGVVMAGNIPLVGFHDVLCVLLSGHKFLGKLSSKDNQLMELLGEILVELEPGFKEYISFTDGTLEQFDAIIATGSNNTSRYFKYYFGKYPNIIRKSRNSIALLSGNETESELEQLSDDVFLYFGMGCRSVSKFYAPEGYSFDGIFRASQKWQWIAQHNKFANNYEYHRALLCMNKTPYLDSGFFLCLENEKLASPISSVHYQTYKSPKHALDHIEAQAENIQCMVTIIPGITGSVKPGQAQRPKLWDYADGIDTLRFLININ